MLTVQRTEYQVDGPLTELAREVLGFGDTADLGKRAKEAEQASHYASVRFQPDYARAQDVRDGYIGEDRETEAAERSEEHTSELQSLMRISYAVFCLKKKIDNSKDSIRADSRTQIQSGRCPSGYNRY